MTVEPLKPLNEHWVRASGNEGDVLTTVGGRATWAASSGGGSSGSSGKDRRWTVPAGVTSIDEFNDGQRDAAWVRVDKDATAIGRQTWTEGGDSIAGTNVGGDASQEMHALVRPLATPLAAGDAILGCYTIMARPVNYAMAGLVLADGNTFGSGTQVAGFSFASSTAGQQANSARRYTGYNTHVAASTDLFSVFGVPTYGRLVLVAAGIWRYDLSPDGNGWLLGNTIDASFTPTHVGMFATSYGTTTQHVASHEFLRRVSGIS